jgi:hypothetical protein
MTCISSCCVGWAQGSGSPSNPPTIGKAVVGGSVQYVLTAEHVRQMTQALVDLAAAEQQNAQLQTIVELQRKNAESQAEVLRVKDASLADKDKIIALERELRGKVEARVVQLEDQVKLATKVIKKSWIRRAGDKAVPVLASLAIVVLATRR